MSHVHVCLVSDQPIPNLTTSLQLRPDIVVLLTTEEKKEKSKQIERVLKDKGLEVKATMMEAYDINNVMAVSENLLNEYKNREVSLNITGGTKIETLGTFQAFYTMGKTIYYVDTSNNKILKLFPESEQTEYPIKVSIPIKDYLSTYGFIINSFVRDDHYIYKRKELTNYLGHLSGHKNNIIGEINYHLHEFNENSSFPITATIPMHDKLGLLIEDLDSVVKKGKDKVTIGTYDDLRYLKGIWFEEYVYMLAKGIGVDEVRLNVQGKWITKGSHPPKNEFDILLAKGTRLFYISCKTANPERKREGEDEGIGREYLYELDSIGDRALGLFGKRMLASARTIENHYIRERAKILSIDLVDGKNILTLKEKLRQWLHK